MNTRIGRQARRASAMLGVATVFLLTWNSRAWAYIDPNAGGMVAQVVGPLVSLFIALLFYCRKEVRRLLHSLHNRWKGTSPANGTQEDGRLEPRE